MVARKTVAMRQMGSTELLGLRLAHFLQESPLSFFHTSVGRETLVNLGYSILPFQGPVWLLLAHLQKLGSSKRQVWGMSGAYLCETVLAGAPRRSDLGAQGR